MSNPFLNDPMEKLLEKRAHYEKIIAEQSPDYVPPINSRTGKRMRPPQMPWMVPHWEQGLQMVNEAIMQPKFKARQCNICIYWTPENGCDHLGPAIS